MGHKMSKKNNKNKPIDSGYKSEILFNRKTMVAYAVIAAILSLLYEYAVRNKYFAGLLLFPFTRTAQLLGLTDSRVFYELSLLIVFLSPYLLLRKRLFLKLNGRFLPCPNKDCRKSVQVWDNWRCDHCNSKQKESHFIIDKCDNCGRTLETVYCEHCHQEMKL
jgi:hypothetical protein